MPETHSRLAVLLAQADDACRAAAWDDLARHSDQLGDVLPPRLELLARAIIQLIDEGDVDLVPQLWSYLRDAASGRRPAAATPRT